ncbi:hypothetical protein T10_1762, partial [Trichinella papuae]
VQYHWWPVIFSLKDGDVGSPSSVHLWSSVKELLEEAFDSLTPVSPPIVNSSRNPSTHNMAGVILMWLPYNVASHLKIFTPVGIPMIIVAADANSYYCIDYSEWAEYLEFSGYEMGSPPPEVSKKVVPKLRSVRSMVIPPARTGKEIISINDVITMKLMLPTIDEIPAKCKEKITRLINIDELSNIKAGGNSQNPKLFNRGNDISVAPAIIGISQFPNPLNSMGITMKKIMASA